MVRGASGSGRGAVGAVGDTSGRARGASATTRESAGAPGEASGGVRGASGTTRGATGALGEASGAARGASGTARGATGAAADASGVARGATATAGSDSGAARVERSDDRRFPEPENLIGEDTDLHAAVGEIVQPYFLRPGGRGVADLCGLAERFTHPAQRHAGGDVVLGSGALPLRVLLRAIGCPAVIEDVDALRLEVLRARLVLIGNVARAGSALEDLGPGRNCRQRQERNKAKRQPQKACSAGP